MLVRMLRSVAVPLLDGVSPFELGVICEVFGIDRSEQGLPRLDFRVCAEHPGRPLRTKAGYAVVADYGLDAMAGADLVAVPAAPVATTYPPALLQGLRRLDGPLHIDLRRIALDIEARGDELKSGAQVVRQGVPVEFGAEENVDIPLVRLKNTIVAEETRLGQ